MQWCMHLAIFFFNLFWCKVGFLKGMKLCVCLSIIKWGGLKVSFTVDALQKAGYQYSIAAFIYSHVHPITLPVGSTAMFRYKLQLLFET